MNAAAAAVVVLNGRQAFDPRASLFAHNEPGFWYDPSDLSSMYQDSAGTTPVTAVEQAVGLILDKSKGLVLGPELVTNGDFSGGTTGWAGENATLSVVSGKLRVTSSAAGFASAYQTLSGLVANGWYVVAATVQRISGSGTAYVRFYDTAPTTTPIAGPFFSSTTAAASGAAYFQASADGQITLNLAIASAAAANETADFNLVSVRAVPGNHAIQPTSASRPILRSRYNLLTYSEQFDNAAWLKNVATVSGQTVTASAGAGFHYISRNDNTVTGSVTVMWEVKRDNNDWLFFTINDSAGVNYFNIATGAFGATNPDGLTATALEDGWYRITGSKTLAAQVLNCGAGVATGNGGGNFTAAGTEKFLIRKVDARRTIDAISGIPSYQKVEAATVYDTVGFPVYLAFDGSDDSLYTGGNLVPGTDKVQIFAGITKLSDAAQGVFAELSATIASNNGTFLLAAPDAADATFGWDSKGTAQVDAVASTVAAPRTAVLAGIGDIGGDNAVLYVDNVAADTDTGDQGTGDYGSYPLYIGRRNNTSAPFNGRMFGLIGRFGPNLSDALRTQAARWMAAKQGRTL